jgi:hypothetical protein
MVRIELSLYEFLGDSLRLRVSLSAIVRGIFEWGSASHPGSVAQPVRAILR